MATRRKKEFTGSWLVFVFWLLIFFPAAIIYLWMKMDTVEKQD